MVKVLTKMLTAALKNAAPILGKENGLVPVLRNVRMIAGDGELTIQATDLATSLTQRIECEGKGGPWLVNGRQLSALVSQVIVEYVEFGEAPNGWLAVNAGAMRSRLATCAPDDWPALPALAGVGHEVEPGVFGRLANRTAFAMLAGQDARYYLQGLQVDVDEAKVTFAATDGHRLAYAEHARACPGVQETTFMLSGQAVALLRRLSDDQAVTLGVVDGHGWAQGAGWSVAWRTPEGAFPAMAKVLTMRDKATVVLAADLATLASALSRVSSVRTVSVELSVEGDCLTLSALDADLGEVEEDLPVAYTGKPARLSVNSAYLAQALAALATEEVTLSFSDELAPLIVQEVGSPCADQQCVIMPCAGPAR